jgi:hypothetical protein
MPYGHSEPTATEIWVFDSDRARWNTETRKRMQTVAKKILRPAAKYVPAVLKNWWRARNPYFPFEPNAFVGFSEYNGNKMEKVARTPFYQPSHPDIPGWMTPLELHTLYALARWLPGPITEIGSWLGRATSALARGVVDSGSAQPVHTYDLRLTQDNFRKVNGMIGMFLPEDDVARGLCSEEMYQSEILPVLMARGGSSAILRDNLARLGLLHLVKINVGDFRSFSPIVSGFVFCDAMHDDHEIEVNAPALVQWMRSGSILACHDVGRSELLIGKLRRILVLGHGLSIDSLYVSEVL